MWIQSIHGRRLTASTGPVAPRITIGMRSHQALKIAMVRVHQADIGMHRRGHRLAGDLGVAVRDRDRAFLVQAKQHLRPLVAEIVHEAVVQAAIARARIERDIGDAGRAQRVRRHVAAEAGRIDARRNRAIECGQVVDTRRTCLRAVASVTCQGSGLRRVPPGGG